MEYALKTPQVLKVAEVELSYKSNVKPSERFKITTSNDAYQILIANWDPAKIELQEQFKILLINRRNRVLGIVDLATGGVSGVVVDPKLIFVAAIKANATGVMLAHNHPSGDIHPSKADEQVTQRLKECGRILEVEVLDHLIISTDRFYSFADEGLL